MKGIRDNTFLKHNAVFWTASLFVSFLNYLYYPVLGRLMDPVPFGETQTIISIFTQAAVFFQVVSLVSIAIIAKYTNKGERDEVISELSRLTLIFPLLTLLACVLFSSRLTSFFHFTSAGPFFVLAILLLICVPFSFANAYLQGHKQFKNLATSNILSATIKLLLAVLFVLLGFGVIGAVGALVCAQVLALAYAVKNGQGIKKFITSNFHLRAFNFRLLKPELPYASMVMITALTTNLMLSFDILVVKHYFPPEQAGLYSGISIISNIIYFLSAPFASVLVPSIRQTQSSSENTQFLKRSLRFTLFIGGSATLLFLLIPKVVITLLLGHRYAMYASNLRGLSLALFALSVSNLLTYYHIGLRHFLVAPAVLLGLVGTLGLLVTSHATIGMVVRDLLIGAVGLLILLSALLLRYREKPA